MEGFSVFSAEKEGGCIVNVWMKSSIEGRKPRRNVQSKVSVAEVAGGGLPHCAAPQRKSLAAFNSIRFFCQCGLTQARTRLISPCTSFHDICQDRSWQGLSDQQVYKVPHGVLMFLSSLIACFRPALGIFPLLSSRRAFGTCKDSVFCWV